MKIWLDDIDFIDIAAEFTRRGTIYEETSSMFYDESDYEQGNYFQGLSHGLFEAARLLNEPELCAMAPYQEPHYNDHPPLT